MNSDVSHTPIVKRPRASVGSLVPPSPKEQMSPRTPKTPQSPVAVAESHRLTEEEEEEAIQRHLIEKVQFDPETFYLQEKLLAMEISAEFLVLVESFQDEAFTEEIQSQALIRLVESYYISQGTITSKVGRKQLGSFSTSLQPFWAPGDSEVCSVRMKGDTVEEIVQNIQSVFEQNFSGILFCRAFGYALLRLQSTSRSPMDVNALLDAYCLVLYSIKLLQGQVKEFMNVQFGDVIEEEIDHYRSPQVDMTADDLLWCFGILFLRLGLEIRKSIKVPELTARMKPSFGAVLNEELLVAQLVVQIRSESPVSYFSSYRTVMDLRGQIPPPMRREWMKTALGFVTQGLKAADEWGDPFYQYLFRVILAYFMPTRTYAPTPYSIAEIYDTLDEARQLKKECREEVFKSSFSFGEKYETSITDLLSRRGHETMSQLTQPLLDVYSYPLMNPNGKYSPSLSNDRRFFPQSKDSECGNCGKALTKRLSCSKCGRISYCNRKCQLAHWKNGHKKKCKKTHSVSK